MHARTSYDADMLAGLACTACGFIELLIGLRVAFLPLARQPSQRTCHVGLPGRMRLGIFSHAVCKINHMRTA